MIMEQFSTEYYRALARIVLDKRFRSRFSNAKEIDDKKNLLKDGGFELTGEDIIHIDAITTQGINIDDLINQINDAQRPPTQVKPVDVVKA